MALDKYINELDTLQTLKDSDLITIGRASDGRLFQCSIAQLKAVLPSTGVNGKSAYQLAVENGYTGTLQQWLSAINGKPGSAPEHEWSGTLIRFRNPDGTWGTFVDLKGEADGEGSTSTATKTIPFDNIINDAYTSSHPNLLIYAEGNLCLSVTDTQDGDSGYLEVVRLASGIETLSFNGKMAAQYQYPTGIGVSVFFQYKNTGGVLTWFCRNYLTIKPSL